MHSISFKTEQNTSEFDNKIEVDGQIIKFRRYLLLSLTILKYFCIKHGAQRVFKPPPLDGMSHNISFFLQKEKITRNASCCAAAGE